VAIEELDAGPEWLRVAVDVPGVAPEAMWRAWTEPDELKRWWPQEAEIDLSVGGAYHMAWPTMGWHVRGAYTEVAAPGRLAFTWSWDHEPDVPTRTVSLDLQPMADGGGTRIVITHGPYGEGSEEAADREGHLAGWADFLARLAELQAT
jgi:uncharacterized protein YndB with AHSA1/START domain